MELDREATTTEAAPVAQVPTEEEAHGIGDYRKKNDRDGSMLKSDDCLHVHDLQAIDSR